jgi:hypothetical protein
MKVPNELVYEIRIRLTHTSTYFVHVPPHVYFLRYFCETASGETAHKPDAYRLGRTRAPDIAVLPLGFSPTC